MSSIDQLPPERDLPGDRHARLRTRVLTAIAEPATRRHTAGRPLSVRIATAGVAMAAFAALGWVGLGGAIGGEPEAAYALGDEVLSPQTREAGRRCLEAAREDDSYGRPFVTWPEDSPPRLLNHEQKMVKAGPRAVVAYQVQSQILYCALTPAQKAGPNGPEYVSDYRSTGRAILEGSKWLPGPISMEYGSSSVIEGGYASAVGRVSERVARVVLDDGAGHRSVARLGGGTFAVVSDDRLKPGAVMLISYDASGAEIDRRPALHWPADRCYTDPAGTLVDPTGAETFDTYRSGGGRCAPAERWTRRNSEPPAPR